MRANIYITGEIGVDTTLLDVIKQVKAQPHAESYFVSIQSVGGFVDAGNAIYSYLKNLDRPVTTYAIQAFSIASVVFMAGSTRIVPENTEKALMIHLPWMKVAGSHEMISSHLNYLKATEDQLVNFYSEALGEDKDTIQYLLSKETYLNAQQALDMGFATMIQPQAKAVARLKNNENKEDESLMNKLERKVAAIYNKVFGIKAELVLQDATAAELTFPDLGDGDMAEVGSKATVDGKPADGEYLMSDGSKLLFDGGELKEIVPTEALEDEAEAEPENAEGDETPAEEAAPEEDKDALIAELQAENEALKAKISELEGGEADAEAKEDKQAEKMVAILAKVLEKSDEQEARYQALAKQIGSDFHPNNKKENTPTIKASADNKSRAWQILNS